MFVTCFLVELHRWSCFVTMGWGQRNIASSQSRWQSRGTACAVLQLLPCPGNSQHPQVASGLCTPELQRCCRAGQRHLTGNRSFSAPSTSAYTVPHCRGTMRSFLHWGSLKVISFFLQKVPHLGNFIQIWMSNAFREHEVKLWGKYTALSAPYPSVRCTQGTRNHQRHNPSECTQPLYRDTSMQHVHKNISDHFLTSLPLPSELHKVPLGCLIHSHAASLHCCLSSRFTSHILLGKTGNPFHWGFIWALLELILQVFLNTLALKNGSDFYPTFPFQM